MSLWRLRDQNRTEANISDAGGPVWGDHLLEGVSHGSKGVAWRWYQLRQLFSQADSPLLITTS